MGQVNDDEYDFLINQNVPPLQLNDMRYLYNSKFGVPDVSIPLTSDLNIVGGIGGVVSQIRGSIAWYPDDYGVYQQYAVNVPGFNKNGIFLHPARINVCTNYNAEPDVEVTNIIASAGSVNRVDRTVLLASAGLSNICPQFAFQFVNTSGSQQTVTITGALGATSNAALSIWAIVSDGDAQMQLSVSGLGTDSLDETASFVRYTSEDVSGTDATDQFQLVVPDGVTIEWVLNQLETDSEIGVCASHPIITEGATGSVAVTTTSFSSDNIPTSDFSMYMEVTPSSEWQMGGNSFVFDFNKDANNNYSWFSGDASNNNFKLRYASTNYVLNYTKFAYHNKKSAICFKNNLTDGLAAYCNGKKGNQSNPIAQVTDITGGTCYLGQTTFTNSLQFHGQIGNIKIFNGIHTDEELQELTDTSSKYGVKELAPAGIPFYDPNDSRRIWSLRYNGTTFDAIQFSNNSGKDWHTWKVLDNPTLEPFVALDSSGNIYYFTDATNYVQQNLYRIDISTKAETSEIAPSNLKNWSWQSWAWGEDSTGTIFTSFYTLDGVDGQLIWAGTLSGTSWVSKSILINGLDRHVHSLHVDPFDDKVWVSWGDNIGTRGTAWSDDDFATKNNIVDGLTDGPTGLTFTIEGVYISSDIVSGQNYLRSISDDINAVTRWESPQAFQLAPMYFCRAIENNPNEMWIATRNETLLVQQSPALFKLSKASGISSKWKIEKIVLLDDAFQNNVDAHIISAGLNSLIPDQNYLFIYKMDHTSGAPLGLYRIDRR